MNYSPCTSTAYWVTLIILVVFLIILVVCYCKQKNNEPFYSSRLALNDPTPPIISMHQPLDFSNELNYPNGF